MPTPDLTVVDDAASSRFTLFLGREVVAFADYSLDGTVVTVPYVETDAAHRGRGLAAVLMDGMVESIRTNGRTIRPICSYAASYLRERPETHDLVAL